jgi:membrane protease YdiL (CAAX protease family)
MPEWRWSKAFLFAATVCAFYWTLSIAGSFGPQIEFAIPKIDFAIGSKFALVMIASFLPAIACVGFYAETRKSLKKLKAPWSVYLFAGGLGLGLPFTSYFGSHYSNFPWNSESRITLVRVLIFNLLLSPLWEEIIWRGCFLRKLTSFVSEPRAIVVSSFAWTVWHGGFVAYLYSGGIPLRVLLVLPLLYFCMGIILSSVFEMGRQSLWPCVLLHAGFDASTTVYYTTYNRASELSSYVAELIVAALVAAALFMIVIRRDRSLWHLESSSQQAS